MINVSVNKVLIVDDDENIVELIRIYFENINDLNRILEIINIEIK